MKTAYICSSYSKKSKHYIKLLELAKLQDYQISDKIISTFSDITDFSDETFKISKIISKTLDIKDEHYEIFATKKTKKKYKIYINCDVVFYNKKNKITQEMRTIMTFAEILGIEIIGVVL